jgi:Polyketide cyclase / dehydrase and lipid transport
VNRSDTQTISIDAPPAAVLSVVGDPARLPAWAPDFARAVRRHGEGWVVDTGAGELHIDVRVSRELRTVDFLAAGLAAGVEIGAFSRVVPNGAGSVYIFTQFLGPDDDLDHRRAVVAGELQTVRRLCEEAGLER